MLKTYKVVEKVYICGVLESSWRRGFVLKTEEEAEEYHKAHIYVYDTIEKIKEWHKSEFYDNFCSRVVMIYSFGGFGSKFLGLHSSNINERFMVKDYSDFNVTVKYELEEVSISLKEIMECDSERAIQYLLERGITMLKELT